MHKKVLFSLMTLLMAGPSFSTDTGGFLSGGQEVDIFGSVREEAETPVDKSKDGITAPTSSSESAPMSCDISEQTFLPMSVLQRLSQKKPFVVQTQTATDSSDGIISVDLGHMASNCNDMISFVWGAGEGGDPHTFGAQIKKPTGNCAKYRREGIAYNWVSEEDAEVNFNSLPASSEKYLCKYEIVEGKNGVKVGQKTEMFEPNLKGFFNCLERSQFIKDGKPNPEKVALVETKIAKSGFNSTGKIMYYCNGPECNLDSNGKGTVENKARNPNACQHLQDIIPGGRRILSKSDRKSQKMDEMFREVCKAGDYKYIEKRLPDFAEASSMKKILTKIRNNLLMDEVKKLKEALKEKSYEDLDAKEFKDIIADFYTMIVVPKRKAVEKQLALVSKTKDKALKKERQKVLDAMVKQLIELTKGDERLSMSDFNKMQDFSKKAPLHKESWRTAAEYLFKGINTGFHFGRFSKKIGPKLAKAEKNAGRTYPLDISLKDAKKYIKRDVKKKVDHLDKLATLAKDKDGKVSYANRHLASAENLHVDHQIRMNDLQQNLAVTRNEANECYNPVIGMFGLLTQNCLQKNQQKQQKIMNDMNYYSSPQYQQYVLSANVQGQMNQANFWAKIEADRNKAYGITPQSRMSQFSMDPTARMNPNFNNGLNNYQAQQYQMQALMRQQQLAQLNSSNYQNHNYNFHQNLMPYQQRQPTSQNWGQWNSGQPTWNNNNWGNQNWMMMQQQPQQNYQFRTW